MGEHEKIQFRLQVDEDCYPPVSVETIWGIRRGEFYIVDSIPFFSRDTNFEDTIKVRSDAEGGLWFKEVIERSSNSLFRIVFFDASFKEGVAEVLVEMGCDVEFLQEFKLLALSIPANVPISLVQSELSDVRYKGVLDFEEAIIRQ